MEGGEASDEAVLESVVCAAGAAGGVDRVGLVDSGAHVTGGGGATLMGGDAGEQVSKVVHHRCGYTLLAHVVDRFAADEFDWNVRQAAASVVVNYRDPADGLVKFLCPRCNKPLQLWWEVPA